LLFALLPFGVQGRSPWSHRNENDGVKTKEMTDGIADIAAKTDGYSGADMVYNR